MIHRREQDAEQHVAPDVVVHPGGDECTVVFLHGLLGINEHWAGVVERVRERATCLLVELPLLKLRGDLCSIEGATNMVATELRNRLDGPAVLIGNSFGGHLAMRIALDDPTVVSGLVLSGSSGLFERTFEKDVQHRPSKEWLEKKIRELFHDPAKAPAESIERAYAELSDRAAARAMVRLSKSAKNDHMGERMRNISHPTLLIWGKQDIVTPPSVAEEFSTLIPDSRLRWIDECGHAPMIEQAERFSEELHTFLDEVVTASQGKVGSRQEVA